MNVTILGFIVVVIIAIVGIVLGCLKKSIAVLALYILGLLALIAGVYLLPATMWKPISTGFLVIGVLLEAIAIGYTLKEKRT